jgi:Tfp pilus assembly protein PilF
MVAATALLLACGGCRSTDSRASDGDESRDRSARATPVRADLDDLDVERIRTEARLALQKDPLDSRAHLVLAELLAKEDELDQAIVGFRRTLALEPRDPAALYNLGTALLRRGEAAPACRLLEDAATTRPGHAPTFNNLGKAYHALGLPELAVASFREAASLDPSNDAVRANLLRLTENADAPGSPALEPAAGSRRPSPEETERRVRADAEAATLRELVRDLPHVTVERRGDQLVVSGWTSSAKEHEMLQRILAGRANVLDLTTDDSGDPQRMIEVDAAIFVVIGLDSQSVGFNFLRLVQLNFSFFSTDHDEPGFGFQAPGSVGPVGDVHQSGWFFGASVDYAVNIANATDERVAVLARPHLTTLSGTPATFLAGGEIVFRVSGLNSGDIKPYPFGTNLTVTPTLLRTPEPDGTPRVHLVVESGRTSVLPLLNLAESSETVVFDKVQVKSEAVVGLGQTLILSGLSQKESRTTLTGVPILRDIPVLKLLFSSETVTASNSSVIMLLAPRDPAFIGRRNQLALAEFVEKRRAFVRARQGGEAEMERYRATWPDWDLLPPNRFASHFFLMQTSEVYRAVVGGELGSEDYDLSLLGQAN